MIERLLFQIVDPFLIPLHSVTRVQDDGGFEFGDGDVEADGSLHRPQILVPRELHPLLAALIRLVADARPKLEALVLSAILSVDA